MLGSLLLPSATTSRLSEVSTQDVISGTDRRLIGYMLSEAVAPSTLAGYQGKGLPMWRIFLRSNRHWSDSQLASEFIVGLQEETFRNQHRIQLFILYDHFLKAKGVADCNIYFKALGHDFRSLGYTGVADLLKSKLVMIARQFGTRDMVRAVAKKKLNGQKEAVSGEMMLYLRATYWSPSLLSTNYAVIDRAVTCLVGWSTFEWGLRIGNLTKTDSDRKQIGNRNEVESVEGSLRKGAVIELDRHTIRAGEVTLEVNDGGILKVVTAFQYSQGVLPRSEVKSMMFSFVSSKTNQKGDRRVAFRVEESSVCLQMLLEMLSIFVKFAQYDTEDDLFFSRVDSKRLKGCLLKPLPAGPGSGRKRYRQNDVNSLIKLCAVNFNLDPKKFSSKSFKNGGITTTKLNRMEMGMSEQDVANQFDHKSISSNKCYQRSTPIEDSGTGPLRFVKGGKAYSHRNLQK